ncbi:hypothetical protein AFULGI_00010110 [Archaeoglobus fulgidus DSM 8774]|uniref:Uncharacterized protein n=1 Tax=Archaeoglobus fulgidus DSM 8774 TaxID=1344584 RepID=A0A075WCS3_ARCFL|nr:hypothetical protein [Archaeoglobus fulgidus]AIG97796.1 hypothetical protein AFULGI_00010110 [Archaeoglobus fulgidus DSM 8774]
MAKLIPQEYLDSDMSDWLREQRRNRKEEKRVKKEVPHEYRIYITEKDAANIPEGVKIYKEGRKIFVDKREMEKYDSKSYKD